MACARGKGRVEAFGLDATQLLEGAVEGALRGGAGAVEGELETVELFVGQVFRRRDFEIGATAETPCGVDNFAGEGVFERRIGGEFGQVVGLKFIKDVPFVRADEISDGEEAKFGGVLGNAGAACGRDRAAGQFGVLPIGQDLGCAGHGSYCGTDDSWGVWGGIAKLLERLRKGLVNASRSGERIPVGAGLCSGCYRARRHSSDYFGEQFCFGINLSAGAAGKGTPAPFDLHDLRPTAIPVGMARQANRVTGIRVHTTSWREVSDWNVYASTNTKRIVSKLASRNGAIDLNDRTVARRPGAMNLEPNSRLVGQAGVRLLAISTVQGGLVCMIPAVARTHFWVCDGPAKETL